MSAFRKKCKRGSHLKVNQPKLPEDEARFEGNYIISRDSLKKSIEILHSCQSKYIKIEDGKKEKSGHDSALLVSCTNCHLEFYFNDPGREKTNYREGKKLNMQLAFAADAVGMDYTELKKFCAIIGVDGPSDSYDSVYQEEIHEKLWAEMKKKLEENRQISHSSRKSDGTKPTEISIKCDGTYQKRGDRSRGYTSKIGITILFDADTDLPIDFEVESKHCHTCTYYKAKLSEDEFQEWLKNDDHGCQKSFDKPSSEMERASLYKMYQRSLEYNLVYKYLISDGDSKAYADVWDFYDLCKLCKKHKSKLDNKTGEEYKAWKETASYKHWCKLHADVSHDCKMVIKVDCCMHVSKTFAKRVELLAKGGKAMADKKSINLGKHRLGKIARVKLQRQFRNAVKRNVRKDIKDQQGMKDGIDKMRKAIMAVLYNICDLDAETRHQYCLESWCVYKSNPDKFVHQPLSPRCNHF